MTLLNSSPDATDGGTATGKRHLVVADSGYGHTFWEPFCRRGRSSEDLRYLVLCLRPDHKKLYDDRAVFTEVVDASPLLDAYGGHRIDRDTLARFAATFERETGSLISDVLQSDRHLGRGYSYSGQRHPLSPLAERATYWDSVALIKVLHDFYRDLLAQHGIDTILLGGIASLPIKLLCVVARTAGVRVRVIASARVGNRFVWARDEFFSIPQITENWNQPVDSPPEADKDGETPSPETLGIYAEAANYQSWFSRRFTLAGLLSESFRDIATELRGIALRTVRGDRAKAGRYHLGSRLRNHMNVYLDYRRFRRRCASDWKEPQDTPFVFLPLHVEPEASLTVFSPEFNSQVAVVDLVAKALPAGVTLVVKEHRAAIGRRPLGFYDWLASIPSVVLAPLEASGPVLARRSRATVTITGTAGFEAAVCGVPVLSFGEHNFYACLPHVQVMRDVGKLRQQLRGMIESEDARADYRADGERLFRRILSQSIDLGEETVSPKRLPSEAAIAKLFEGFRASLQDQDRA